MDNKDSAQRTIKRKLEKSHEAILAASEALNDIEFDYEQSKEVTDREFELWSAIAQLAREIEASADYYLGKNVGL